MDCVEPLRQARSALNDPKLDLIICHAPVLSPWNHRWWLRSIGSRRFVRGYMPLTSMLAPQLLRIKQRVPIAIVDMEDTPFLRKDDLFLLDACKRWFKRELPIDSWRVFMRTDHDAMPTRRYRMVRKHGQRIEKFRPMSLGPSISSPGLFPTQPIAKTADLFFAGQIEGSSTVRVNGLKQLEKLRNEGFQIDIPMERLPQREFYWRAAAAHLVWSPEGYGWDCFRHYEAPLCWSVPLINQPSIQRHAPLLDRTHAIYYDIEGDGLCVAVREALKQRQHLSKIAADAHAHVTANHTLEAIVHYIIKESMTL